MTALNAFARVLSVWLAACLGQGLSSAADSDHRGGLGREVRRVASEAFPEQAARAQDAYGIFSYGAAALQPLDASRPLPPRAVLLVHGMDDPGTVWKNLAPALEQAGYTVCQFVYPNDQAIRESADLLNRSVPDLRRAGVEEIAVIAHSMGGLVSREWLTSPKAAYAEASAAGQVPRVRSLVLVGVPNHGSP